MYEANPLASLNPYEFRHLIGHLIEGGRGADVHRLLGLETSDGLNAWYEAKRDDAGGYATDVGEAWRLANTASGPVDALASTFALGLQVRYALVTVSVNSRGEAIPSSLLAALVKNQIWTPEHALAHALRIPETGLRAEAVAALASYLSEPLLREAVAATDKATALAALALRLMELGYPSEALALLTRKVSEPFDQQEKVWDALAHIVPRAAELGCPEEALVAAREVHWIVAEKMWTKLAASLPRALIERALGTVRTIENEMARAAALTAIAPHLQESLLPEALETARKLADTGIRARVLIGLAPRLPASLSRKGLQAAREVPELIWRARSLIALASVLPDASCEALTETRRIKEDEFRAHELAELASFVPETLKRTLFDEALEAARLSQSGGCLLQVARRLPGFLAHRVVSIAQQMTPIDRSVEALTNLMPILPGALRDGASVTARLGAHQLPELAGGHSPRVKALARLIEHLSPPQREEALHEALTVFIENMEGLREPAYELRMLVPCLSERMLRSVVDAAQRMSSDQSRGQVLTALARHLPTTLWAEALAMARRIPVNEARARVLSALAAHMTGSMQREAVIEALAAASDTPPQSVMFPMRRVELMGDLAKCLPAAFLPDALAVMRQILDQRNRAQALAGLAPYLPGPALEEALDELSCVAGLADYEKAEPLKGLALRSAELGMHDRAIATLKRIEVALYRDPAIQALAARSAELGHPETAFVAAQQVENEIARAESLGALVPDLSERLLLEALASARQMSDAFQRAKVLAALVPRLPEQLKSEILRELITLAPTCGVGGRYAILADIASQLPPHLLPEWLSTVRQGDEYHAVRTLIEAAPHLPEPVRSELLREVLPAARRLPTIHGPTGRWARAEALTQLLPHLSGTQRQETVREALEAALEIKRPESRAKALGRLAVSLPEPLKTKALRSALAATEEIELTAHRAESLTSLSAALSERLLGDALTIASNIAEERDRALALVELFPCLPEPLKAKALRRAFVAARGISDGAGRAKTLRVLALRLSEPKRAEILREALIAARAAISPAKELTDLAAYLPEALKTEVLREALIAAQQDRSAIGKETALREIASHLAALRKENLLPIWQGTLSSLATKTRKDALATLPAFVPVMVALGGSTVIEEVFQAIQDVGRWWP